MLTPHVMTDRAGPGAILGAQSGHRAQSRPGELSDPVRCDHAGGLDRLGMPVGLQLIAKGGDDERLVAIACAVERVLGRRAKGSACRRCAKANRNSSSRQLVSFAEIRCASSVLADCGQEPGGRPTYMSALGHERPISDVRSMSAFPGSGRSTALPKVTRWARSRHLAFKPILPVSWQRRKKGTVNIVGG